MNYRFTYNYAMINLETGECTGVVSYPRDMSSFEELISIPEYNNACIGKYYIDGTWYERAWNEYDDDGNPVESAGYVDTPWEP